MSTARYRGIRMRTSQLRVRIHLTSLGQRVLLTGKRLVITERVSTYERIPGLGTTRQRPRFHVAWS